MVPRDVLLHISDTNLVGCHPRLISQAKNLVERASDNGLSFAVFMGYRSWDQQGALYAQGRQPLDEVNRLRVLAHWEPLMASGNKIVTDAKAGESWHNYGLAADLVEDGDANRAGIQWSWSATADYMKLGKLAPLSGLEWGGLWKSFKDYPHVQDTGGLSLSAAKLLYATGGIPAVWRMLDLHT